MTVHQRHLKFKLEIGQSAQPPYDHLGLLFPAVVGQQSIEGIHPHFSGSDHGSQNGSQHIETFGNGKEGRLGGVLRYSDNDAIKNLTGPANNIQMPVGNGIKTSGIDHRARLCHDSILITDFTDVNAKK